jgi:hypothetical protein
MASFFIPPMNNPTSATVVSVTLMLKFCRVIKRGSLSLSFD